MLRLTLKGRKRDRPVKIRALQALSGSRILCINCACREWDALHLDHINDDGYRHRRKTGLQGMRLYRWVVKNPVKAKRIFQVLCANCNQLKQSLGYLPQFERD